jgi:hypothetical protein
MTRALLIIFLFLNVFTFGQTTKISEAADGNEIEYSITGSWSSMDKIEYIDANGQYFGKCMTMEIQSKADSSLKLMIDNGLMLMSEDTLIQNMVITKPVYVTLLPKQIKTVKLYAMCSELHDGMPFDGIAYHIGEIADPNLVGITQTINKMFMHNVVGQGAVWAYTDNATEEDLRLYGATDESLTLTIELLNKAGIFTSINPQNQEEELQEIVEEDPIETIAEQSNVITLNAYIVYGVGALFLLLIILLIRKNKQRS